VNTPVCVLKYKFQIIDIPVGSKLYTSPYRSVSLLL